MIPVLRPLIPAVLLVLGVLAVLAGGYDDSPGLQGIGLLLVIVAAWLVIRAFRRRRAHR